MSDKSAEMILDIDLSNYIEVRIFGERPHIRNRRIPVATIAYCAIRNKWGVARLMEEFFLDETEVLSALLYYQQEKNLIDAQEKVYQAELDEAYRLHGQQQS